MLPVSKRSGGASVARILTTHAGSLPRPEPLTRMLAARYRGETVDPVALDAAADAATEAVVAAQLDAGIDVVNDGEMGRESFFTYVRERMSGFSGHTRRPAMADLARYPGYLRRLSREAGGGVSLLTPPAAVGEVRYRAGDADPVRAECARLRALLAARGLDVDRGFVTAPSPGIVAAAMENRWYERMEDYVADVAAALAHEYRAIVESGFTLQIDAPDLAMERHTLFQDRPLADFLEFAGLVVAAINRALDGLPRERVRLHVCWGNYEGAHDCDVALADVWDTIRRVRAGAFLIALANPRHAWEHRVLREEGVPDGAVLVAGVIDTTTNYVEHPETVAERLALAAEAVGSPERLVAATDCGFETSAGFGAVAEDIVWAKLRALAEGARLASERL